jgi:hypothetical protein
MDIRPADREGGQERFEVCNQYTDLQIVLDYQIQYVGMAS